jgi:hypothetical protein
VTGVCWWPLAGGRWLVSGVSLVSRAGSTRHLHHLD